MIDIRRLNRNEQLLRKKRIDKECLTYNNRNVKILVLYTLTDSHRSIKENNKSIKYYIIDTDELGLKYSFWEKCIVREDLSTYIKCIREITEKVYDILEKLYPNKKISIMDYYYLLNSSCYYINGQPYGAYYDIVLR